MRSTQFEDQSPFEEQPEERPSRNRPVSLCETIRRLGYAQNTQVRMYGEVFNLVSDPFSVGEHLVFVDALERKSGRVRRVRIPSAIVERARTRVAQLKAGAPKLIAIAKSAITLANGRSRRETTADSSSRGTM